MKPIKAKSRAENSDGLHQMALQAEANITPLDLRMEREAIGYYYKLRAQEDHGIRKRVFNDNNIANLVRNENVVKKPQQERIEYPKLPPWEEINSHIHTSLTNPVTKAQGEIPVKQAALEYSVNKIQVNLRTLLAQKWIIDLQMKSQITLWNYRN